jgi:cyclophilin family peptidyl-prolyl cis-trans isomerase
MARTREPDSADCQFFINVVDNSNLDYPSFDGFGYAVFGHVTKGMEVVDIIVNVPRGASNGHNDVPLEPVIIKSVRLE